MAEAQIKAQAKTPQPVNLKRGGTRTLQFHSLRDGEPFVVSALSGKIKITSANDSEAIRPTRGCWWKVTRPATTGTTR